MLIPFKLPVYFIFLLFACETLSAQSHSRFERIDLSPEMTADPSGSANFKTSPDHWQITNPQRETHNESEPIPLFQHATNEFITLTPVVEVASGNPAGIELALRLLREGEWTQWQAIPPFHEQAPADNRMVGEMQYLSPQYTHAQLKVRILTGYGIQQVNRISLDLFDPGEIAETQPTVSPKLAQSAACPCLIPGHVDRLGWNCPDGNTPSCSSPAVIPVTHMIVHHSAGSNSLTNWPAVVLSIWNLHTITNGWCDIGYNWLIDPNGVVYEGRGGGNNVRGAHFCGTNSGTMGVCMIGTFTNIAPTAAALASLDSLLAWKACDSGLDPASSAFHNFSGLNLNRISGHRDGCSTECPGSSFYPQLPNIRTQVETLIAQCDITGLTAELPHKSFRLFPNPSTDHLTLSWERNLHSIGQIMIVNAAGREVFNSQVPGNEALSGTIFLPVSTFSSGLYYLQVQTEAGLIWGERFLRE